MKKEIVLGMVEPYIKNNTISYEDFENIFSILNKREQYDAVEILKESGIEFVDYYQDDKTNEEKIFLSQLEEQIEMEFADGENIEESAPFQILYDEDSLFRDGNACGDITFTYDDIKQTNQTLCQLIQGGNRQARSDLCVKNRKLVDKYVYIYQKYYGNHLDFDDLEQVGMVGLLKAAEKFDVNFGTSFSTYAVWWIQQAILREIFNCGFAIRIPAHIMERIFKIVKIDNKLFEEGFNYEQRLEAIENELGLNRDQIEQALIIRRDYLSYTSLDVPVGEEKDTTLMELIIDDNTENVEEIYLKTALRSELFELLQTMSERERNIIVLRFGLMDGRARTLEEIGTSFGVTRERIRQIEAKALKKLKTKAIKVKLSDYLWRE